MSRMAVIRKIIEQWELRGLITCYADSVDVRVLTMCIHGRCIAAWRSGYPMKVSHSRRIAWRLVLAPRAKTLGSLGRSN
jgi:hypothetical protein